MCCQVSFGIHEGVVGGQRGITGIGLFSHDLVVGRIYLVSPGPMSSSSASLRNKVSMVLWPTRHTRPKRLTRVPHALSPVCHCLLGTRR
jgi:hypothetical protein